jgi:hypothetical protein
MQSNERCTWITRSHSRIAIECKDMSREKCEGVGSARCSQSMSKYQEREPKAGQQVFIDVPLRIELLFQNARSPDASVALTTDATHRVRCSRSCHVSCVIKFSMVVFTFIWRVWCSKVRTSDAHQTRSSKVQTSVFRHLTCPSWK